jgi:glycosyltransferase involved in cell wall biosynthesis
MRKKKVLILTDRFYPEEVFINAFIPEFNARGVPIEILTQAPSYPFGRVEKYPGFKNRFFCRTEWNGLRIYRIFTIEGYREKKSLKILHYIYFAIFCSLVLIFIGRRYDRIFVFQSGPLIQAIPGVLSKKLYRNKLFIWTLDLWPDTVYALAFKKSFWLSWFLDWIVRTVYSNCDEIFVSSPGFIERIREYVPDKKIYFLPQWSEGMELVSESVIKLDPGFIHFTFTGNVAKTQNLEMVIQGFCKAHQTSGYIRLNIFGDGRNLDELKLMVEKEQMEGITFWGRQPQTAMASVFSQSHVLVISLKPDPLFDRYIPLKFSSYIQAKKPIFAILNGEVRKLVEAHDLGLWGDPSDVAAIAAGFIAFTRMKTGKFEQMSNNSIHLSNTIFSKESTVGLFFSLFR